MLEIEETFFSSVWQRRGHAFQGQLDNLPEGEAELLHTWGISFLFWWTPEHLPPAE